jgi:hypothetical protein
MSKLQVLNLGVLQNVSNYRVYCDTDEISNHIPGEEQILLLEQNKN